VQLCDNRLELLDLRRGVTEITLCFDPLCLGICLGLLQPLNRQRLRLAGSPRVQLRPQPLQENGFQSINWID
jgi:hypothetical protein